MPPISRRIAAVLACVVVLSTAGCAPTALQEQYREGSTKNYVAGDGTIAEWSPDSRGEPVEFAGTTETGADVTSSDYRGRVLVVNFWYAACAPCRAEAPDLQALNEKYEDQGADFLGINIRDSADTAIAFAGTYGVTYPSIIDVRDGTAALAFAGEFAPNAVPTTVVLDRQGRVGARILGRIPSRTTLDTLIRDILDEPESPTS